MEKCHEMVCIVLMDIWFVICGRYLDSMMENKDFDFTYGIRSKFEVFSEYKNTRALLYKKRARVFYFNRISAVAFGSLC